MLQPYLDFEERLEYGGAWPVYRRWLQMQAAVHEAKKPPGDLPFDAARPPAKGANKIYSPGEPDDYLDDMAA